MNDDELEQLLNRYRPAGPPDDLMAAITRHGITRSRRIWPWALAAAALLMVTIGLHVSAVVPIPEATSMAQSDLARQFGGDALADRAAQFILASQATADASEEQMSWAPR